MAKMYAVFHGPKGLKRIASKIHELAVNLDNALSKLGIIQLNKTTLILYCAKDLVIISKIAEINEVNFNYIDEEKFSISINENIRNDIQLIIDIISKAVDKKTVEFKIHENESKFLTNIKVLAS